MSRGFQPKARSVVSGIGPTYTTGGRAVRRTGPGRLLLHSRNRALAASTSCMSHLEQDADLQSDTRTRVTLAHDYLLVMRGAERTFAAIAELYPRAPIFTLLYDEHGTNGRFAGRSITTSALQRLGVGQSGFRRLLPLYPFAVERLRPAACEVVLSSSSAFAHGIHVPDGAVHVCYCHA